MYNDVVVTNLMGINMKALKTTLAKLILAVPSGKRQLRNWVAIRSPETIIVKYNGVDTAFKPVVVPKAK